MNTNTQTALQRLQASRASLQAALHEAAHPPGDAMPTDKAAANNPPRSASTASQAFQGPGLSSILDTLLAWRRKPLAGVATVASALGHSTLTPIVRAHPGRALGAATLAGAAIVWLRPWRGRWLAALGAGLGAQLTATLVRALVNTDNIAHAWRIVSQPSLTSGPKPTVDAVHVDAPINRPAHHALAVEPRRAQT
jgi:hypothetical protein